MANYQVFFTNDGSTWYGAGGTPGADPVTNTGGIDLSVLEGVLMYPTLQGTGDIITTANFGQNAFVHAVPAGYTAGWPTSGGGFTVLDPAKAQGSGAITGGGLGATFSTVAGMVQATDGYTTGQYYFELTQGHLDVFAQWGLGGLGRDYTLNAGDYNHWIASGAFKTGDPDGGALVRSGDGTTAIKTSIQSLGAQLVNNPFTTFQNTTIGVAVFLTENNPPPVIPSQPVPRSLKRWRGQVGLNWLGMALVGDAFSNVVGLSDFDNFTEYGNTMRMLVTTPPIQDDRKRIFFPRFEIEVQAGDGIPGSDTPPVMMLDWSKDGGTTWSDLQLWRSMGKVGDYTQRLRWLNLGQSRQWVFRLSCTDPVRRYIIGVYDTAYKGLG